MMEDRKQLEKMLSYIEEQQNIKKVIAPNKEEENNKKSWREKVWKDYTELKEASFEDREDIFLVAVYFACKPDETVTPLLRRLQMVMKTKEDIISGGMLAASYYGIEELSMRIPVLEGGIGNLYTDKKFQEALTGSIMIADGGPAEVAKAIQWYMFLMKKGFDMKELRMARLIGMLAVISSSTTMLGDKLINRVNKKIELDENIQKDKEYIQDILYDEACAYIRQLQNKEEEKARKLEKTSYKMLTGEKNVTVANYTEEEEVSLNGSNLLVGMKQEVELLLWAIYFGL